MTTRLSFKQLRPTAVILLGCLLILFLAVPLAVNANAALDTTPKVYVPAASGKKILGNSKVKIDVSNIDQGYLMVRYSGSKKTKLQITRKGSTTYTYNLKQGSYEAFPLSDGSGSYSINVFENVAGNQYSLACGETIKAEIKNSTLPFLYANQYVNFNEKSTTVATGAKVAAGAQNQLEVVDQVYHYVIGNISYDYQKAKTVASGYLPNVDAILKSKTGICFDYAAVMATMLRTQGIPTKLVVGYAGNAYHAWISVYIQNIGWIDGAIYFDGKSWVRMDPTFASSAGNSSSIQQYIGDGKNYKSMYVY